MKGKRFARALAAFDASNAAGAEALARDGEALRFTHG